ncbi:MAG: sulfoxide reductase heme-binding subunit YedZ [Anaerolineae bacterium]|nr:sulfoxide reductase heme-binding subunit YedZ [Anaerolineae bacterium]MDL1925344.1 sulfoxide reductase heme-binding subunit YedZ [Anaerolineae bacterium AMX1]
MKRYTPLQILVHVAAWFPLARLVFEAFTGGLTANPIQHIEQRTGRAALTLLILALAVTPLNSLFGWSEPIKRRRALGLYAFMYAVIHVTAFADLDYGLAWGLVVQTIFEKPYILLGAASFLLLIPLAVTSFDVWQARLKKRWKRLHMLIYLIAPMVILHYAWGKKGDFFRLSGDVTLPLAYAAAYLALMALRLPALRRAAASLRGRARHRLLKRRAIP